MPAGSLTRVLLTKVVIAIAALAGTVLQMLQGVKQLSGLGPTIKDAVALEELRSEHPFFRHPFRWMRRQREIWLLLNPPNGGTEDIAELRSAFAEVWMLIGGWALLMGAAVGGLAIVAVGG